jgi:ribosomal protein L37AE/L43A
MEVFGSNIKQKLSNKYCCEKCNYNTQRKSNFDNHLLSAKHLMEVNGSNIKQKLSNKYCCENCNKIYQTHAGLWKHNKNCNFKDNTIENTIEKNQISDKDLIMILINENKELKTLMIEQQNMMMKVIENGTHNTTTTHTNSHNKAFNLNFFLNETCKDAMNIMDFVDSIKLQLSDLEGVGELGYVEGISNIILKNLKELDVTQRPVHCTDKKRETMYIKDEDKWEKDDEKLKLHKVVRKVTCKNQNLIPKFKEEHPDCGKYHSKFSDQYNKIVVESMGGSGNNDYEKEEKIIQNISKQVFIDKEPSL